jgi:hypothetical protein
VFDANPDAKGDFCNLDGVLVKGDGKITGLDRNDATLNVEVGGRFETSCVGMEIFPRMLSEVVITAAASTLGCDVPCKVGTSGCDSHQWADVFVGPTTGALIFLARIETTYTLTDYTLPIPATLPALGRIAVCRSDGGKDRDDESVDFIGARCL